MDFTVNGHGVGEKGSELKLNSAGTVHVTARVAARLDEARNPDLRARNYAQQPYWHIERARIGDSREVPVEVIVNGYPVAQRVIVADGKQQDVAFDVPIERSSWVALRILASSHTNPVFVVVGGKPIRASRRSAQWCLDGVDKCWSQKKAFIQSSEKEDALQAYEHERPAYRR